MKATNTMAAIAGAARAAPEVSVVTLNQRENSRIVNITYTLSDEAAIVTVGIETNGVAIPDSAVTRLSGDVSAVVQPGARSIVWNAGADWPEHSVTNARARVTAWVTNSPPQYCAVNVIGGSSASPYPVYYYPSAEGVPGGVTNDLYKTTQILMRKIPPTDGTFKMGSPSDETGRTAAREAQVDVSLTKAYYVGIYQVTQYQWERVMGDWPSYFNNTDYWRTRPLENRSWNDIRGGTWPGDPAGTGQPAAGTFIDKLCAKTDVPGFDLPTDAQWEYACRAGTTGALNDGTVNLTNTTSDARLDLLGRYKANGGYVDGVTEPAQGCGPANGTAIVGSYAPNEWGLYDTHANVWNWCLDGYADAMSGGEDPLGAESGSYRVLRGGSWYDPASNCRSAYRVYGPPLYRGNGIGFRLVRTLP